MTGEFKAGEKGRRPIDLLVIVTMVPLPQGADGAPLTIKNPEFLL